MPRSLLFWVIYILAVLFAFWGHYQGYTTTGRWSSSS